MDAVISFLGHRSTCWKAGCWQWMDVLTRARSRRQTEIGQLRLEIPEIFGGEDGDGDEGADEADDAKGRENIPSSQNWTVLKVCNAIKSSMKCEVRRVKVVEGGGGVPWPWVAGR